MDRENCGGERVIRLITLATPHHGSPGANGGEYFGTPGSLGVCFGCLCEKTTPAWRFILPLVELVYWRDGLSHISTDEPNRNVLLWDNYNNTMGGCDESNVLIPQLSTRYDYKIIAYAGVLDNLLKQPLEAANYLQNNNGWF